MVKRSDLVSILLGSLLALGIACQGGTNDCADGLDNDGDGLTDDFDPGCALNGSVETPDSQCSDRTDNDADGLIDMEDPGCINLTDDDEVNEDVATCKDGIDNDADGLTDFPVDPGCSVSVDDSEEDDCPGGDGCPACANGVDDDGDGDADYPADLGCDSAADGEEFNADPTICGGSVPVLPLPPENEVLGTVIASGTNDLIGQGCGGTGPETAYMITVTTPSALEISTDFAETTVDTVLYLREQCRKPETELGCNDDANGNTAGSRLFLPRVEPGDYFLVVDSQPTDSGEYRLMVTSYAPEGASCDPEAANCAPNLECRGGAGSETCQEPLSGPSCNDGGTPRTKVVPTAGDLVISEYMANPAAVDDDQGEWIEVKVVNDVDIGGLQIGRAEPPGTPGSVLLTLDPTECMPVAAGTHVLFARNEDVGQNGGLPTVAHVFGFDVVNSTDGLFIGMDDQVLDVVTYSSVTAGKAESLDADGSTWCDATTTYGSGDFGTPGASNPPCP